MSSHRVRLTLAHEHELGDEPHPKLTTIQETTKPLLLGDGQRKKVGESVSPQIALGVEPSNVLGERRCESFKLLLVAGSVGLACIRQTEQCVQFGDAFASGRGRRFLASCSHNVSETCDTLVPGQISAETRNLQLFNFPRLFPQESCR